jgi:asparagine synthase (glutamine-hydrolysing)
MCGIAGWLNLDGAPADAHRLARMTRRIAHRGPDGEGLYVDGPLALGHRRLAVLDLTDAGAQPMASADGRLRITYNGELYNFRALRAELEAAGARFRSRTDTEVILAAYERWGVDCLSRFNGMFAFALWDAPAQRLWLVRDRLGVKPLFYRLSPGRLSFASEAKAVLVADDAPPRLNDEALSQFLALNYTPAPHTLFEGVRQLLPGQWMTCTADGRVQTRTYWQIPTDEDTPPQPAQRLTALLEDAVQLRLVSDVPVGAFLSGGLDSSAIVGWMRRHHTSPVDTFTAAFEEPSYNEAPAARLAAQAFGARHHERTVTSADVRLLPQIVWHSEELTADSSMLALYRVAELARRHVTVVLSGDGADELFGGYPTYLATQLAGWYRRVPASIRDGVVRPLVERLPGDPRKASLESQLRRFVAGRLDTPAQAHASWRTIFSEAEQGALWPGAARWPSAASHYQPWFADAGRRGVTACALAADLGFYLPNDILAKLDRMTMAWGLEARTPYLDYRVVEFAARLPARVRRGWPWQSKALLRRATRGVVPAAIRRRRKAGFNVPVTRWLQADQRRFVEAQLLDRRPTVLAMFRRAELERLVREHVEGRADRSHQLWGLLALSIWSQLFLDAPLQAAPPIEALPAAASHDQSSSSLHGPTAAAPRSPALARPSA